VLLAKIGKMLTATGYVIGNIDAVVIAQVPKLVPYRDQMQQNLARTLGIDASHVSIKATTMEGLGLFGREEGIGALCTVLIEKA